MSLLCIIFVLTFISLVVVQGDGVFYNPPNPGLTGDFSTNPIYEIGETVQIRWTVSWANISLLLWQNNNNDFEYLLPAVSNPNNYNWIVRPNKNISHENVFFLQVFNAGTNDKFGSHYFNLTESLATTSTISTSTSSTLSTTTSTSTVFTSSVGQASQTSTPSPSPTSVTTDGLSESTKVGLGLGLGLGIPFLIATAAAVWLFNRRQRRRDGNTYRSATEETPWQDFQQPVPPGRPFHELPEASLGISEMESTTRNHELPGK